MADRVDADDLPVLRQLDRRRDDGHVDGGTGPSCARRRYGVPAKLTTPAASASRVTVSPAVASLARRATGARGARSAWSSRTRWAWVATTTPA